MPVPPCPDPQQLADFVLGRLDAAKLDTLAEHVAACTTCGTVIEHLGEPDDPLAQELRQPSSAAEFVHEAALQQLLPRLRELASGESSTAELPVGGLAPSADLPAAFGRYRVRQRLGGGGMGEVYLAHDEELDRLVAVKVPRFDRSRPEHETTLQRFLREAQILAKVRHPHVCPIHDVGRQDGAPYVVMAYLDGESLTEELASGSIPVARAVALMRAVASAVDAVHEQGVIHRDLKPGNILFDQSGEPFVTDFGLARPVADAAHLTHEGVIVGTPAYMAPEQARNDAARIGRATDVYSLGVVLYQLLAGRLPFQGGALEVLTRHLNDPPPPLTGVGPGLAAVVARALAKDPANRYPTARAFADALAAAEAREPTAALPPVSRESPPALVETRNLVAPPPRRRRGWLVAAAVLLVAGGAWLAGEIIVRLKDKDGKTVAEVKVPGEVKEVEIERDGKKVAAPLDAEKPRPAGGALAPEPLPPLKGGDPLSRVALTAKPAILPGVRSWTLETVRQRGEVAAAFNPTGDRLATAGEDGTVRFLDAETGRLQFALVGIARAAHALTWSPDGRHLACVNGDDGRIVLWDVESRRLARRIVGSSGGWAAEMSVLAWSPDGKWIAAASPRTNTLIVADPASGAAAVTRVMVPDQGEPVPAHVSWSPDGRSLAVTGGKAVWFMDPAGNVSLRKPFEFGVGKGQWSPDGKSFALGHNGELEVWDGTLTNRRHRISHGNYLKDLGWLPDGKSLCTGSNSNPLRIISAESGQVVREVGKLGSRFLTVSPDGSLLVGVSEVPGPRFWDARSGASLRSLPPHPDHYHWQWFSFSSDQRYVAWSLPEEGGNRTQVCDLRLGQVRYSIPTSGVPSFSPDGRLLALTGGNTIRVVDLESGELKRLIGYPLAAPEVPSTAITAPAVWSADGRYLAVGASHGDVGSVGVVEVATGKALFSTREAGEGEHFAWSPCGKWLLCSGRYVPGLRVVDTATWKIVKKLDYHSHAPARWSVDGKSFAAVNDDGVQLVDFDGGKPLDNFGKGQPHAWLPDGKTLITVSDGRHITSWDAATGRRLRAVDDPIEYWSVLSPNGSLLAWRTAGTLRVREIGTRRPLVTFVTLSDNRTASVSPDGHLSNPRALRDFVYVVELDNGTQETLTPEEFERRFGWKNDPEKVKGAGADPVPTPPAAPPVAIRVNPKADGGGPVLVQPEPLPPLKGGEPLSRVSLVAKPAKLPGARAWTVETTAPRGDVRVAFSPKGRWLATAGDDGTLRLLDASTGRLQFAVVAADAGIVSLAWSSDEQYLAVVDAYGDVSIWIPSTRRLARRLHKQRNDQIGPGNYHAVAWSPDGRTIALWLQDGKVRLFEAATGKPTHVVEAGIEHIDGAGNPAAGFGWLPDSSAVVMGGSKERGQIRFLDRASGKFQVTKDFPHYVYSAAVSPTDARIAFRTQAVLEVWDRRLEKRLLSVPGGGLKVVWSADGKTIATAGRGPLQVIDADTGKVRREMPLGNSSFSLSLSPDGQVLASSGGDPTGVHLWDTNSGQRLKLVPGLTFHPQCLRWSPDGRQLAWVPASEHSLFVWRRADGDVAVIRHGDNHSILNPTFSPDGRQLTVAASLWEIAKGERLKGLELPWPTGGYLRSALWSPNGKRIAASAGFGEKNRVWLWDASSGKVVYQSEDVYDGAPLGWSPDSKYLVVTAASRNSLLIHDAEAGRLVRHQPHNIVNPFHWSPDGKMLAVVANEGVRLVEPDTGRVIDTLGQGVPHGWLGDGKTLVTVSDYRHLAFWDTATGRRVRSVEDPWEHGGALSPDAQVLAWATPATLRVREVGTRRPVGTVVALGEGRTAAISPEGHLGNPRALRDFVYVVQLDNGTQEMLTPEEFEKRFGWKNDPAKVRPAVGP